MSDPLEKACKFIIESLGCPHEMFDWESENCSHENCPATEDMWVCWKEYFEEGGE